ncbi:enoyl-CoA hydratase/isomerase family protein [Pelagibius sp. Alg239-R121]|uniref:enoyl-CoA hydratase/isomerase family protein n=1 Tax=Pelagibius sp. Alg239-R121 TaxID=2993448 RepID=UPI0024A77B71|nr:enoyl-CoA hydratase/isomerase family protein [Pelagibius sp. Alg239-R121]
MTEESEEILYEVKDDIGLVTFNRPQARNALTFGMYRRLAEICRDAPDKDGLKAIIVCGAGDKAFAAGTDIAQFRSFSTAEDALNYEQQMDDVLGAVERCSVPTIAAIHGACTGGGAGIAAACDLRIAAADFRFGFPIARTLGNCLSVENLSRLTALIGAGRTREVIFTARLVGAEEAKSIGLISEILDDRAAVMTRAEELASLMAGFAPLTLQATKEGLRRLRAKQADLDDHDLVTLCYTSADFKEGLEAFLAKRKPDWQGR